MAYGRASAGGDAWSAFISTWSAGDAVVTGASRSASAAAEPLAEEPARRFLYPSNYSFRAEYRRPLAVVYDRIVCSDAPSFMAEYPDPYPCVCGGLSVYGVHAGDRSRIAPVQLCLPHGCFRSGAGGAWNGILSKFLYAYPPDGVPIEEARAGAMLMYYGGDAIDLVMIVLLFRGWYLSAAPVRAQILT